MYKSTAMNFFSVLWKTLSLYRKIDNISLLNFSLDHHSRVSTEYHHQSLRQLTKIFAPLLSHFRQMPTHYLKIGGDLFHPFHVHHSLYVIVLRSHFTLHNPILKSTVNYSTQQSWNGM